jgi:hypothetical protein
MIGGKAQSDKRFDLLMASVMMRQTDTFKNERLQPLETAYLNAKMATCAFPALTSKRGSRLVTSEVIWL